MIKKDGTFVTPVKFELILQHKEKECLIPVVYWLLENGCHSFQWEMIMLEKNEIYQLSIQTLWAANLTEIAKLIKEYD